MVYNKNEVAGLIWYYEHGTKKPNTPTKCIACRDFENLCDFLEYLNDGEWEFCFLEDMSVYTGPCGRCGFPDCEGWIEREK